MATASGASAATVERPAARPSIVPPGWPERTNWNAAILLTLTAARMLAMQSDTELAGTLARSARVVAALERVRDAVQGRLGLRQAGESQADAVVRGSITRYEPDVPTAYTGNDDSGQITVTKRLVQITVTVEIMNQRTGRALWQRSNLTLDGDYNPPNEAEGREKTLDKLVTNIVEGAQSQW